MIKKIYFIFLLQQNVLAEAILMYFAKLQLIGESITTNKMAGKKNNV